MKGFIPLILFAALGLAFAIGLTKDPSHLPSEMIDRPLPQFSLTQLYDETEVVTNEALLGNVSLINVFGSWCVACVQEHPTLVEIGKTRAVTLIGIDWRDDREDAKRWLARHGDPYDIIAFDGDSALAIDLGVTGAPESFIVDKAGQIRYKFTGIITPDVWRDTLRPVVENLRAEG